MGKWITMPEDSTLPIGSNILSTGVHVRQRPKVNFTARAGNLLLARSDTVYSVNRRWYFPLSSLNIMHFKDSEKCWT